jgi:hypothetical protein
MLNSHSLGQRIWITGGLMLMVCGSPCLAGSSTAGSVISKQNAIANASNSLPAGAQITDVSCTTLIRDLSPRYSCTVHWTPAGRRGDG